MRVRCFATVRDFDGQGRLGGGDPRALTERGGEQQAGDQADAEDGSPRPVDTAITMPTMAPDRDDGQRWP